MKASVYKLYDELPLFINSDTGRQIRWFPAERKTRYYIAIKMPNWAAETMANAIIAALFEFPTGTAKSITCSASSIPKAETFPEFPLPP